MSTYTAIIGDPRSIGASVTNSSTGSSALRLNPAVASARVRVLQSPHIVMSAVGGLISCDFTIPVEEAQLWRPVVKYGSVCWLFDGQTPIFFGYLETPTWSADGSCLVEVSGPWALWSRERFREAWDVWDMNLLQRGTGANEAKAGQATLNSDGTFTLSIPNGTTLAIGQGVSVDFLLFGETAQTYDDKAVTAFEFNMTDSNNLGANIRVRVLGKATAAASTGDQLYDTAALGATGLQGAANIAGTNQGATGWPSSSGYRCLRLEMIRTAGSGAVASDTYATFNRIRFGTREALFPSAGGTIDTAAIARDVVTARPSPTVTEPLINEFWLSSVVLAGGDTNSTVYALIGGGVGGALNPTTGTGTAPNSGVGVNGFSALEWQSPTEVLTNLVGIDTCHVGFYLPYGGRAGYDMPGAAARDVGSWWLSPPPQLFYQAFPDPVYAPDYTIHVRDGAEVAQDTAPQPLVDQAYVNYNTLRGRQLSEVQVDADVRNYLYAQGFRRSEDWALQPSVGDDAQARQLAQQQMTARRQPSTGATITITNDDASRYPIRKAGAVVSKLATVRPGSMRIIGAASGGGLQAGYATQVEWWGQTLTQPETLQITLGQPGEPPTRQAHGHLVNRTLRTRRAVLR